MEDTDDSSRCPVACPPRVARPSDDLDAVVRFCRDGLGFSVLGGFKGHDGFDGVMLGRKGAAYHLEFTRKAGHKVGRAPTEDNLLVFYLPDAAEWSALARRERRDLDAAIHVDTGMNRSGLSHDDLSELVSDVRHSLAGINLVLVMSHLAQADEPDREMNWIQLARFRAALALLPSAPASLAASAGTP